VDNHTVVRKKIQSFTDSPDVLLSASEESHPRLFNLFAGRKTVYSSSPHSVIHPPNDIALNRFFGRLAPSE